MKYCTNCGAEMQDNESTCPKCGAVQASSNFQSNPQSNSYQAPDNNSSVQQDSANTESTAAQGGYNPNMQGQPQGGYQNGYNPNMQGQPQGGYQNGYNPNMQGQPGYQPPHMTGTKNKVVAGILGILLGALGIHKFYLGYTKEGIIMLLVSLLTCGIGAAIMSVFGLIEGIMYLTKSDEEFAQIYEFGQKGWF